MNDHDRHRSQQSPLRAAPPGLRPRRLVQLGLMLLGAAVPGCSGSDVSIGSGQPGGESGSGLCGDGIVQGNVAADTQEEIEALRGCREVSGDLTLHAFPSIDLTPLSALRIVRGDLSVGAENPGIDLLSKVRLEGLESLEQVNNLRLRNVLDADLSALRNLRRVNLDPQGPHADGGTISIFDCNELRDLRGLDSMTEFMDLWANKNARLSSLSGLPFPRRMRSISLAGQALVDLSALATLREVETFDIGPNPLLQNLDGLALEEVDLLTLLENDSLQQVDSLSSLKSLKKILVARNERLLRLPSLDGVTGIVFVTVVDNAQLRSVPSFNGGVGEGLALGAYSVSGARFIDFGSRALGFDVFEVGDNPRLTRIDAIGGFFDGGHVAIYGNTALTEVNFGVLGNFASAHILDNPVLSTIQLYPEARIVELEVKNNPNLSVAAFASVQSLTSDLSGNLDDPMP